MALCIAKQLVENAASKNRTLKLMYSVHIFLQCVSSYSKLGIKGSKTESDVKNAIETVGNKVWESAITEKLSCDDIASQWNERIMSSLQLSIENELSTYSHRKKEFIHIYCAEVEKFNTTMKGCLTNIAMKAIDGGYMIEYWHLGLTEKERFRYLLSDLFRRQWQTHVTNGPQEEEFMRIFKMAISWPPIQLFVRNLTENTGISLLMDDCKENLLIATSMLESHLDTLETGKIEIGILQVISGHSEGFSETLSLIRPKESGLKDKVLLTIKIRMLELEAFKNQSRQMTVFVNLCQHLESVDTRAIDEVLQKTSKLEKHSLVEFCEPIIVKDLDKTSKPDLRAFNVESDVLDILPKLEGLTEGQVFKKIWKDTCSGTTGGCKTPLDVINVVWKPAFKRWKEFCEQLKTGELMFEDAERMFGIFKNDDDRLLWEMMHLEIPSKTANERIKQIKQNRQLSDCVTGAKVILKFQQQYRLQGDYQAIKTIVSHSERNFKLREFDKHLMKTCEILKEITKKQSNCLDAFVKSANLVKWLKESMQTSGQKELKVFVDLAMMSAGEEPLNIAKVQCLHSAVLGYSPLIFDLDETDCNYIRLLDMCKVVWKELAANPNLPKQLLDTNREIEWLKDIKKAHGSVEVTSLMQAEAINTDGIYTVGKGAWKGSELSDMDLQSRLMLVAGKSDSSTVKSTDKKSEVNVDRFTMIFDSITRLGSVYLKLCSSGCVLFNGWNANFICSLVQERPGRKSDTEGLEDMVPKIADFMEKCYGEWLDFIKQKRKDYLYLNFFTIDQLVILQRELVKMGTDEEPSLRIYHLLSAVKENCMQDDVVLAMEKAKKELSVIEEEPGETSVEIDDEEEEIGDQAEEKIALFIHELMEAGCDEVVARQSVGHVKQEDIDDCDVTEAMLWCMDQTGEENEDAEMNQDDVEGTEDIGPRFSGWSQSTTSISSLIKQSVTKLWINFLGSISSNISDYLSLEHLGIILNVLAKTDEVLSVALSIYMYDPDQPLPQSDEVLVCTSDTTADEVCIFWRRAIYDNTGKIHCLLHADLLDFDVSETAEQCLEELLLDIRHYDDIKYRLFVICGSDNEYRSTIVSSLEKYVRQVGPVNGLQLKKYVTRHLEAPVFPGKSYAAMVDFKRSTVRVIKSTRAGVGKTLFVHRKDEAVQAQIHRKNKSIDTQKVSIPLQEKVINLHSFIQRLLEHTPDPRKQSARIFHLNMNHEVQEGVDYLLFNLLILNCLVDRSGYVWRRSEHDLYLIEAMPIMVQATDANEEARFVHPVFTLFPDSTCRSPDESLQIYSDRNSVHDFMPTDQLFDEQQFRSPVFQRTFQYLLRLDQRQTLESVRPSEPEGDPKNCLDLVDFEQNQFVSVAAAEDLPGFATFVLRFLIQMSRDFSTRSLNMSEESPGMIPQGAMEAEDEDQLELYQMRRTWESSPHPYLFFNSDRFSFTFLGFYIDRNTGNLVDQQTNRILEQGIMGQNLYDSLLCSIMGVDFPHDPDSTYELTTDNVKKIMAIFMRFRCDIPVIIMGETGCGKTRLIKFMCELQSPPGVDVKNMILMKVHGGTTNADIKRKVNDAEIAARVNIEKYGRHMYTVLFFDEANTTEAIGLIKEIMHSDELIRKLEQAGLGYHVDADETTDRLGRVPMRRLVYRVQPLPQSLLPLVWDFGQLNTQIEELYIRQMVRRYINDDRLPNIPNLIEVVSRVLTVSQDYMRAQRDECSFVSLRDVERVLTVMAWFYDQGKDRGWLFGEMDRKVVGVEERQQDDSDEEEENEEIYIVQGLNNITRALILAIGVCYHACLKTRQQYRQAVAGHFRQPCNLQGGEAQILDEIERCQEIFLDNVSLEDNIARNTALKENVFMMVVCIELRIPLFLVGKPGSSKSLAKTIVSDAMQGNSAKHDLFKLLKQVQMVSFQCSPLSTPDGIVGTFRQCAQFQKDKDLQTFVSAVVLDEVGLAEDSPRMPLKTLHPLLEDGCQGDEDPEPFMKVAFIGISNWALDPAKMNRGILVQREVPDLEELQNSARGICGSSEDLGHLMEPLIEPLSISYLEVFAQATQEMREFFGLRDFYSLVKMVYSFVENSHQPPTWYEMLHAIRRNFGGLEQVKPEELFRKNLTRVLTCTTGVCRNINKIKVCMETGNTVVLLNLDNLYESLYDALNQYYVYFGGERYVDLGLGTHRVKCPVHRNFRLIVVAEKQTVYKKFPIPLINRLEKHFLTVNTILNDIQQQLVLELEEWANDFASQNDGNSFNRRSSNRVMKVEDVFIGFHKDTCSAIILDVSQKYPDKEGDELLEAGKLLLLWCATPESVVRRNKLDKRQQQRFQTYYHERQAHGSLISYLQMKLKQEKVEQIFAQVTTHNKLLASVHKQDISLELGIDVDRIILLETLSSFDTEQQFTNRVQQHLQTAGTGESLMLVQCDSGDVHSNLIACARYIVMAEYEKAREILQAPVHVIFILQLPRKAGGCFTGFQCGRWHSVHIDDLWPENTQMPDIQDLQGKTVSGIFHSVVRKHSPPSDIEEGQGEEMDWTENGGNGRQQKYLDPHTVDGVNEEVDMMDIDAEFNTPIPDVQKDLAEHQRQPVLKLDGLIMQCVQSALAMVKDKEGYTHRETERVDIVLKCLRHDNKSEQGADTFLTGLQILIGQLLKEKEKTTEGDDIARLWMTREAAAAESINKAGTFRRSCLQTIISKVSPILAGIIAYLDTNRNLDLIHSDYSDLQSPKRRSDLGEMLVMTTGREGHMFSACLPFSWTMIQMIAEILRNILPSDEELEDEQSRIVDEQNRKVVLCSKIVAARPIGKILNQLVDGIQEGSAEQKHAIVLEIIDEYIQDFVHTMYYHGQDDEFKTFSALCLLIENLNPKPQELNEEVQRGKWLHKVHLYRPVVEKVLNLHSEDPALYGIHSEPSVRKAKAEIKCCRCEQKLEGPPVTLPCKNKDVLCDACLREMKALDHDVCPKCHENLGQEWQPLHMKEKSKERGQLIQYQKRCNTFFMDVVAQLCFSDGQPPSRNVLDKLLGYVTCSARDSPLREEEFVNESLKIYIKQAQIFFRKEPTVQQNLVDLSLLIIQCLEDTMLQKWLGQHMHSWSYVIHLLETAGDSLVDNQLTIEKLYSIARTRVGLSQAARVIADIVNAGTELQTLTNEQRNVIDSAKQLCTASQLKWPKIFLAKHLCRYYGIDVYQSICRHRTTLLRWIVIEELERDQTQEVSDRYVVCGDGYVEIREALSQVILGEDIGILEDQLQELRTTGGRVDTYLQLAVHREISCSYVRSIEKRTATPKSLQKIATFLEATQSQRNKPILRLMMSNELEPRHLVTVQGSDTRRQGLQCLIVHFMTVLSQLNGARTLLHLLLAMSKGDQSIRGMFLPTMPQDDFAEIQEVIMANPGGENPVFYRCPNGHPYVIGNMVPIVRPDIEEDKIRHFFWEHIETSIGDLQRALNRSVDDVLLLMHCVIQNIMVKHNEETTVGGHITHLQTKQGRQAWEKQFAAGLDHHLKRFNQVIATDQRLGSNPLMCILYETDTQQQAEDPQQLEDIPRDHILQAIQYIPSILSLQRILLQKFQKKLDKAEANTILMKDMIKVCTTEFGSIVVPKHQCVEPVSMKTPLSVFLPASTENGLCSYAMLDLLFRKQNEFLDSYMKESGRLGEELLAFVELMETTCLDTAVLVEFPQEIHFKHSLQNP
ncbi:R213A-like protein [Mya arenaria]|uniref:R213A-like protein n=1 Tax=Mya arenaria TaxID=6604 RepID=A0ABY7EE11_MYAAR|nr:R213A-like protein [Mya arenaria]